MSFFYFMRHWKNKHLKRSSLWWINRHSPNFKKFRFVVDEDKKILLWDFSKFNDSRIKRFIEWKYGNGLIGTKSEDDLKVSPVISKFKCTYRTNEIVCWVVSGENQHVVIKIPKNSLGFTHFIVAGKDLTVYGDSTDNK